MKHAIGLLVLAVVMTACASNPNRARDIDTRVEYAQPVTQGMVVGVKDDMIIAQKQVMMSEELRTLQNDTYSLEAKVYGGDRYLENNGAWGTLRNCYKQLSQVTGELRPMSEQRNYVIPDEDYKIGLDHDHNIVGIKEEYLLDRIAHFKSYKQILNQRLNEYQDKIDLCEMTKKQANK